MNREEIIENYRLILSSAEKALASNRLELALKNFEDAMRLASALSSTASDTITKQQFYQSAQNIGQRILDIQAAIEKPKQGKGMKEGSKDEDFSDEFEPIKKGEDKTTFDDVKGLDEVIEAIKRNIIYPFKNPVIYKEEFGLDPGGVVLLEGPPGCGKTLLAKAIANEAEASFFNVVCSTLTSKWLGDTGKKIAALFAKARKNIPAVILLDEVDALARSRDLDDKASQTALPALLTELDGFSGDTKGILVLLATNVAGQIDDALISRAEVISIPLPGPVARKEIIQINLINRVAEKHLPKKININELVKITDGFSGRDLKNACIEVRRRLASSVTKGESQFTYEDIKKVFSNKRI